MKQQVAPITPKTARFFDIYLKTGNATEAAMQVFNCSSRASAQAMGSYYLQKNKLLIGMIMEQKGITIGKLIDAAFEKLQKSDRIEWFDRLMKIGGYDSF